MNPEDIKKYVTYDLEAYQNSNSFGFEAKEIDVSEWVEERTNRVISYESMLENVMDHLEQIGGVEFAILKDPELGKWWAMKVKHREKQRKYTAAKEKLYSTMTKEELKILGIR